MYLILADNDWANVGYNISQAIRAAGGASLSVKMFEHPHNYPSDCTLLPVIDGFPTIDKSAVELANTWGLDCNHLLWLGERHEALKAMLHGLGLEDKDAFVKPHRELHRVHLGTWYRLQSKELNKIDYLAGYKTRFAGQDSVGLFDNKIRSHGFFSVPDITISKSAVPWGKHIIVSHSPTSRLKKGTDKILAGMDIVSNTCDDRIKFSTIEDQSWSDCMGSRSQSHIFIDQLNNEVGGIGVSGYEALRQGCIVLADVSRMGEVPGGVINVTSPKELAQEVMLLANCESYFKHWQGLVGLWNTRTALDKVGQWWIDRLDGK